MLPALQEIVANLEAKAHLWKPVPMLARTHGQPASPTRLGKEIYVFVDRLVQQMELLEAVPFAAKFGGATGNFNAHHVAYRDIDWIDFGNRLVNEGLGLQRSRTTTQIEHYDHMAAFFDGVKRSTRSCSIFAGICGPIFPWTISSRRSKRVRSGLGHASQGQSHRFRKCRRQPGARQCGIGTPGGQAACLRLQRDLTDSTVTRNIGVPLGHTLIALKSLKRGLDKLILNEDVLKRDLENNWAVVAEGIQTVLRREGYPKPYEALLALTRTHAAIDEAAIVAFVDTLDVAETVKQELLAITPHSYTGILDF